MLDKFFTKKEDTLVLVIDIQERLVPAMTEGAQVIANSKKLLTGANILRIPAFVTEQYPKGLGSTVSEIDECINGNDAFSKLTFSACTEDVLEAIKKEKRKNIVIVGMETHVCVYQTARQLLKEGFHVFLVEDAVCSRDKHLKKNAIEMIRDMGSVITNVETLLFDWLVEAGNEDFKAISKLVK